MQMELFLPVELFQTGERGNCYKHVDYFFRTQLHILVLFLDFMDTA